jgi:hypothetical protein
MENKIEKNFNISSNSNMSNVAIKEIQDLLNAEQKRDGVKPYHPKKLVVGGRPTKKALAYNKRLFKEGKTFQYLDNDAFLKLTKDNRVVEVKKKYDQRYKTKVLVKSQQKIETYGSVIAQGNLTNKTNVSYQNKIKKEFNNKKNTPNSTIKIDLKKISLKSALKIASQFITENRKYVASVAGTNRWITLSKSNLQKLNNYEDLLGSEFAERAGSDNEFIINLDRQPDLIIKRFDINNQKPNGSFFKYYHDLDMDLTRYDIHNKKPENYNHNCLYIALQVAGVSQEKLNEMRTFVKSGAVPTCKLSFICNKIGIRIHLKKPNLKRLLKFGNEGDIYNLGLIDNHFFLIEQTQITSYAIKNYDDIKHLDNWNTIYKKRDDGYRYSRDRFIDSFKMIMLLLDNQMRLTYIPIDDVMQTQYLNNFDFDNEDLEYSRECLDINKTISTDRGDVPICFFDFETNTSEEKHIPYLVCADLLDQETTCYGIECGEDLIRWIKTQCKRNKLEELLIVAHNLRYDYTFIMDWLYCLKPVFKGNRIMGGEARIYYGKDQFTKVLFLDSCNLISTKLSEFGGMFQLDQGKEIMPYNVYTTKNIEQRYIDLDLILEHIKEDDREQFYANIKKWNCFDAETNCVDIIDYSEAYCRIDVSVLKKGFEKFRKWIYEITSLDVKNYCSIASLGLDYIISEGCFDDCFKMSGRPREFIQRCVVGGRCMTRENKKWKTEKEIADFDAVSLYPSAMARMKGFLKGTPKVIKNKSFDWLNQNTDGYFVKVLCKNNPKIKRGFPLLSKTDAKTGIRNFTNDTTNEVFYIDKTTYEDCVKYQGLEFEILCGYYYDEGHNNKINDVIKHLFQARVDAKAVKNPIQAIYKLLMNSCYGKCLLKPINTETEIVYEAKWDKYLEYNYNFIIEYTKLDKSYIVQKIKPINDHFNNVYAGVEILSMSKRIMNEVICLAEDLKMNIYYQDTDSMHIDNKSIDTLATEFKLKNNRDLIGKGMGQFHSDFDMKGCEDVIAVKSIFLGKKAYADKLVGIDKKTKEKKYGLHIRMKGVNREGIDDYCDRFDTEPMEVYNGLYDNKSLPDNRSFDLLGGGKVPKFKYNADMSVSSLSEFARSVNFPYDKGIEV